MRFSQTAISATICLILASCGGRPVPIDVAAERCQQQADPAGCINDRIFQDTARSAVGGALIGVVAGGIIGYATGGAHRALIGAATGGVGGAVTAAALNYYLEHRDASALADIRAQNRDLGSVLQVYKMEVSRLNADLATTQNEAREQKALNAELTASLQRQMADRERLGRQIADVQKSAEQNLDEYKAAVEQQLHTIPSQIQAEIGKYNQHVSYIDDSGRLNREKEQEIARFLRDNGALPAMASRT